MPHVFIVVSHLKAVFVSCSHKLILPDLVQLVYILSHAVRLTGSGPQQDIVQYCSLGIYIHTHTHKYVDHELFFCFSTEDIIFK